jgi:pyruvate/2-oxoglutarate dehydrogenase complex dihydrolipoamide dehydrogenase (E3) component
VGDLRIDWSEAVDRAQRVVHGCSDPKPADLRAKGARLVIGEGRFVDPHTIAVGEERLRGAQILVATGAHTAIPPIAGVEHALTHREVLRLRTPPKAMTVIGGGVIALEFAYLFARLGVRVTVLELLDHVLATLDREIREAVADHAVRLGIEIRTGVRVAAIEPTPAGAYRVVGMVSSDTIDADADVVVLAAGQVPTVDGIGLDVAGVQYDRHGIAADQALRTNVPHIWAAGDVRRGSRQLSPLASHGARVAARNALLGRADPFDESLAPYIVGLTPPVAGAGATEEEAAAAGIPIYIHRQSYASVCPAANVVGEPEGLVKLILRRDDHRLIGAHAFGAFSGELVQQMAFAIRAGFTAAQLAEMLFVFPGLSQVLEYAVRIQPGDPTVET